jgi:hypothetical protein
MMETPALAARHRAVESPAADVGLSEPILHHGVHDRVVRAAEDLFTARGVPRDPKRLISD